MRSPITFGAITGRLFTFIEQDVDTLKTAENAFRPLNEIWLFEQGFLLTGDPHNKNSFNNNIVIANVQSKAVKIVLLEMRHRAPDLLPVDEKVIATVLRFRAQRSEIGAGPRFRIALTPANFAADNARQVRRLLLGRAKFQ